MKSDPAICRSALYMPASNTRALNKGPTLDADAIIIDLEDSVAPDVKAAARQNALEALRDLDYGHRLTVLRLNDVGSDWFDDDIALLEHVRPHAVLLPKVESAETIVQVHSKLDSLDKSGRVQLWAMLETPKAVVNAVSIAQTAESNKRFSTVCIGNNDLAREAGMQVQSDRQLLIPWLMNSLLAAKAHHLQILDGVYNDFRDLDGFNNECTQGAAMGMDGKTLIHPSQIELANDAFSPSKTEIEQARLIVAEFAKPENQQAGVVQMNGKMVERLHLDMAQRTLAIADRIVTKGRV